MAGNGPPPSKTKRNRGGTQVEELDHPDFEIPRLPKSYKLTVWVDGKPHDKTLTFRPATRTWWDAWCRSPLADEFAEVHWLRLLAVAKLKDRFERDPSPTNATELRLQEAAFGGTPADLRRTGRTIRPRTSADEADSADVVVDEVAERRRRVAAG